MASLSKHQHKGYRIHWRFTVRVGPMAGEVVRGSLLLGNCTPVAAKTQLRQTQDWEEQVKTGRHVPGAAWAEVKEAWLAEQALAYTEQTLCRARRVLGLYERWRNAQHLPCKTIEQVAERRDLSRWRDHRLEKEAGRKTVANDLSALAELFRWCVRERYLVENPVDRIKRPRFTVEKTGKPLTRQQAGRWLRSIQPRVGQGARLPLTIADVRRKRCIGVFLLNTGVRNGEFCTLTVEDVRVDEEAQLLQVFGKGQKYRWVPLNRAALAAIRLHLRSRGNPKTGPLFVTRTGQAYNVRQLASELRKTTTNCAEAVQVNAHNLRHTFATWLARSVTGVALAQKILGHEDVNTTLRHYVHTDDWELAGATANLRSRRHAQPAIPPQPAAVETPPDDEPVIIKFPLKYVG
jgi:site-specific recombinase XerD